MDFTVINPLFQRLSPAFVAIAVAIGALFVHQDIQLADLQGNPAQTIALPAWPQIDAQALRFDGYTFKKQDSEQITADSGPLARRFRLAGTFFAASSYQQSRKAIIDDIQKKTQYLVSEGDNLDQNILVVTIFRDRVVLRDINPDLAESQDEQLWLCFTGGDKSVASVNRAEFDVTQGQADTTLVRFGKRTGERRWVLERGAVLHYYQELLNNPDRLAKVFESLKPVYQSGKIAGYTLDIEGEGEVFRAFGLKQGDVIRQVNSMPMISQSRAEYFINEFVKNRVSGFVIDIERATKPEKMIYLVR
jgi:type II secretory pathway component PulC